MASTKYYGTGRRKKSIARVYLVPGTGKITINKQQSQLISSTLSLTFAAAEFPDRQALSVMVSPELCFTQTSSTVRY